MAPVVVDLSLSSDDGEDDVVCLPGCPPHLASRAGKASGTTLTGSRPESNSNGIRSEGECDPAADDRGRLVIHLHFDSRPRRRSSSQPRGSSHSGGRARARQGQRELNRGAQSGAGAQKSASNDRVQMEDDDCCILEQDPAREDTASSSGGAHSEDLVVTGEVGQVACRDFPHARHQCATYPFKKTPHWAFCPKCHCYVCDTPAPCTVWGDGVNPGDHCHATDSATEHWKALRGHLKDQRQRQASSSGASGSSSLSGLSSASGSTTSNANYGPHMIGNGVPSRLPLPISSIQSHTPSLVPPLHFRPLQDPSTFGVGHVHPTAHGSNHSVDSLRRQIGGVLSRRYSHSSMDGHASRGFLPSAVQNSTQVNVVQNVSTSADAGLTGLHHHHVGGYHRGLHPRASRRSQRRERHGQGLHQPYQREVGTNDTSRSPQAQTYPTVHRWQHPPVLQQPSHPAVSVPQTPSLQIRHHQQQQQLQLRQQHYHQQHQRQQQQQHFPRSNQHAVSPCHQQASLLIHRQGGPRGHLGATSSNGHHREAVPQSCQQTFHGGQVQTIPRNDQLLFLNNRLVQATSRSARQTNPVQHSNLLYQQPCRQQLPSMFHHHQQSGTSHQHVSGPSSEQLSALTSRHGPAPVADFPTSTAAPVSVSVGGHGHGSVSTLTAFHLENLEGQPLPDLTLLGSLGNVQEGASDLQDLFWKPASPSLSENLLHQFDSSQNHEVPQHQENEPVGNILVDSPELKHNENLPIEVQSNVRSAFEAGGQLSESYIQSLLDFDAEVEQGAVGSLNPGSPPNFVDLVTLDNLWGD